MANRRDDRAVPAKSLPQADPASSSRFAGFATLLRAQSQGSASGLDVALAGVPFDLGSSFRAGARHGPARVREASRLIRRAQQPSGLAPFDLLLVADIGDAPVHPLDRQAALASIESFFRQLVAARARPLAVGGDHTVTLPILRALGKEHGPLALVQLDAHSDTLDQLAGKEITNGTVFRRAIEEELVEPERVVQLGLHGTLFAPDEQDWIRSQGALLIGIEEIDDRGLDPVIAETRERVGSHSTYLSLDIDVVDPAFAPGTGGVEAGGLSPREVIRVLRGLSGLQFVGADVVEVCPPLDVRDLTSALAANLLFEELCLLCAGGSLT